MTRRLVVHVAVAYLLAASLPLAANAATTTAATKGRPSHATHAAKPPAAPKIDLNAATESEIATLPGIDAAIAQKIVSMRPYKNSNQLVAKGIVSKDEFSKIRNRVTARQSTMESKAAESKTPGSAEGGTK
ncbi:MAG TPA: helix-hairpin-helix domain-containing protein [Candidatus Eisenbacteria bacterium]|nr:helix-hairpin-helix domain-containing protein [Candidatus Eisenbacteria bacterium]